jgi:hypothetical protein
VHAAVAHAPRHVWRRVTRSVGVVVQNEEWPTVLNGRSYFWPNRRCQQLGFQIGLQSFNRGTDQGGSTRSDDRSWTVALKPGDNAEILARKGLREKSVSITHSISPLTTPAASITRARSHKSPSRVSAFGKTGH